MGAQVHLSAANLAHLAKAWNETISMTVAGRLAAIIARTDTANDGEIPLLPGADARHRRSSWPRATGSITASATWS